MTNDQLTCVLVILALRGLSKSEDPDFLVRVRVLGYRVWGNCSNVGITVHVWQKNFWVAVDRVPRLLSACSRVLIGASVLLRPPYSSSGVWGDLQCMGRPGIAVVVGAALAVAAAMVAAAVAAAPVMV